MYGPKMMMIFYGMLIQVIYNLIIDKKTTYKCTSHKGWYLHHRYAIYIYLYMKHFPNVTWNILQPY